MNGTLASKPILAKCPFGRKLLENFLMEGEETGVELSPL